MLPLQQNYDAGLNILAVIRGSGATVYCLSYTAAANSIMATSQQQKEFFGGDGTLDGDSVQEVRFC
jgi:hypothetical protein